MSGWKDWAIGEVVTESEFQSFVQDQVVQVYDDATDRDNTLAANVAEGMMCYLKDIDETQVYDGTNWVSTVGDITEVVAGTALTGGGTSGSVTLNVDESALEITKSQVTDFAHATTHESGGTDEIEIAQSQVTGLDTGTEGFTALSNGTLGLSYQPVSHNYVINGAFDIWQRGDGPFTLQGFTYSADRWIYHDSGATGTVTKKEFTPDELNVIGFGDAKFYIEMDVTQGDGNSQIGQRIEDARTLAGQTVTLSFWAKGINPGGGTFSIRSGQNFGSDGSPVVETLQDSFSVSGNWVRYSSTFTFPSVAGKIIEESSYTFFDIRQPASDNSTDPWTLELWGVQLEAGSIATPFKRNANSIAGEEDVCKYYYEELQGGIGAGVFNTTTNFNFSINYRNKRVAPTVSIVSPTLFAIASSSLRNPTAISPFTVDSNSAVLNAAVVEVASAGLAGNIRSTSTSKITLSSEL